MNAMEYEDIVKNIQCSFTVENMTLSEKSLSNLERLSNGGADIDTIVKEIIK